MWKHKQYDFIQEVDILIGKSGYLSIINKKIDQISIKMEKLKIVDYVYYLENPKKMLFSNFISGLARGFGAAVGFTLLGAIVIYILQAIMRWNIPLIGEFITDIVNIVQENLHKSGGKTSV